MSQVQYMSDEQVKQELQVRNALAHYPYSLEL